MRAPRRFLRAAAAVAAAAALTFAATPAHADPLVPTAPALDAAAAYGMVSSVAGVDAILASSYGLRSLDPVSGAVTGANVTTPLSDSYAMAADLNESALLALDTAALARRAQEQADAQRRAQLAGSSGALKPGTVPDPYGPMIEAAVAKYCPSLPASVLAAQINAESGFNPRAQSRAGARGIAQFMPDTWTAEGIDGNGDGRRDVWDPQDAIPSAARYDCTIKAQVRKVPGDPVANMLAAYNAGPGAVLAADGIPGYDETQRYVVKILAAAERYAGDDTAAQSAVGPDGCPTTAPANTLRNGALTVGIAKICADSVAGARTPQSALAIKWALSHLGQPYSQPKRMVPGYADCSSFVSRAYNAGGAKILGTWAPTTFTLLDARYARRIPYAQVKPGDLVFPHRGHVAMALAGGFKVHTNQTGDVSKVDRAYTSAYATLWVDPARV